jgi:hypothetical protein
MQIFERIEAISRRAEAINLPLSRLCSAAGVYPSTVSRWRPGCDVRLKKASEICDRLERELAAREAAMLQHLSRVVENRAA